MKKNLFVLLAVIMVLSLMSITACAGSPEDEDDTDGVWCYTPQSSPTHDFLKVADHNRFMALSYESDWTGTFTGASEDYGMLVEHSSGIGHYRGRMLYIGTVSFASVDVDGKSGGLEMYVTGQRLNNVSDWEGSWVITSGTGALEDIRGQGTWWGLGWQGNYSDCGVLYYSVIDLDFEPD